MFCCYPARGECSGEGHGWYLGMLGKLIVGRVIGKQLYV
jgi:hypothetical protein